MDNIKYRTCETLIRDLKVDEYGQKIITFVNNDDDLFWGIRNEALNIYCCGASIVKLIKNNDGEFIGVVHNSFIKDELKNVQFKVDKQKESDGEGKSQTYVILPIYFVEEKLSVIKTNAALKYWDQGKYEKICQQWIVNRINHDENNEWFCLDMEYNTQGKNLGRFDIIAIKRGKENKKHKVCLIELKVGKDSYNGSWPKKTNRDNATNKLFVRTIEKMDGDEEKIRILNENAKKYEEIASDRSVLFKEEYEDISFGSGIVGHVSDFIRFLANTSYKSQLAKNICHILKCQKMLGVKNVPIVEDVSDLEEKPEILIASYDGFNDKALPTGFIKMKEGKDNWPDINELKRKMKVCLFNSSNKQISEYNLQDALEASYIDGFISLMDINETKNDYEVIQKVKGVDYSFRIKFIENCKKDSWNCLQ